MEMGVIYETEHIASGRKYRGQHRCGRDCGGLTGECTYLGSGIAITAAIAKYGRDAFKRRILVTCAVTALNEYEAALVDEAWCKKPDTFNLISGGDAPVFVSEETRAKRSKSLTGRKHSAETRAKIKASHKGMLGKTHSAETRDQIRASLKGIKRSPETRKKMRASQQARRAKEKQNDT